MPQINAGGPFAPIARPELLGLPDRIVKATMRHDTRDHHGTLRTLLRFALGWDESSAWRDAHALTAFQEP